MAITTLNDLYREYLNRCVGAGTIATRDQLHRDYLAWTNLRDVSIRYEETGEQYLDDLEDGPFSGNVEWASFP